MPALQTEEVGVAEERGARLESDVAHIRSDIQEMKGDLRAMRQEFKDDMHQIRLEFKDDMQGMRREFKDDVQEMRRDITALALSTEKGFSALTRWGIGLYIALVAGLAT